MRSINGQWCSVPATGWDIIFNPSFPTAWRTWRWRRSSATAFVVGVTAAWHLLAGKQRPMATRMMFSMAMWMALIVAPIQAFIGDQHGLNTLEHTSRPRSRRWKAIGKALPTAKPLR